MIDGAVYVDGKVAVVYYQPMPKLVKVGEHSHFFDCKFGVSLALVDESEVPVLLNHMGGCCGGKRKIISLASQGVYRHWLTGER